MKEYLANERLREILRFLLVGGGCFLFEFALLCALTEWAGISYLVSSAIAFIASCIVNYILCVTVVFRVTGQTPGKAVLFWGSSVAGLGVNQLCMWLFVEIGGLWYPIAKVIAAAVVMVWNYLTKRFILNTH